jgi:uncharacterized membrane protein YeaQ/YmgE (transglycosylase-associated protein family)
MLRVILGIVAGFIAWSILWVGSDQVLAMISPSWYGAHQAAFEKAMFNKTEFTPDSTILVVRLVISVIISIMSGFLAAVIAKGNRNAPLGLGILLLAVGVLVQALIWNYLPVWYHAVFLLLLIPMTILGGRLKKA